MCCICGVIKSRKHQSTHIQKSKPPQVEPWVTRTREEMDIIKKLLRYTCINRHNSLSLSLSLSVYHTNIHSEWPERSARKIYEMALRVATHICRFVSMPKFKLAEQLIRFKAAFFSNAIFALSLLIIAVAVTIAYRLDLLMDRNLISPFFLLSLEQNCCPFPHCMRQRRK